MSASNRCLIPFYVNHLASSYVYIQTFVLISGRNLEIVLPIVFHNRKHKKASPMPQDEGSALTVYLIQHSSLTVHAHDQYAQSMCSVEL